MVRFSERKQAQIVMGQCQSLQTFFREVGMTHLAVGRDHSQLLELQTVRSGTANDRPRIEYAICVEFHALLADWRGKVEAAARREESSHVCNAALVSQRVYWVTVPPQSKMLDGVEARQRVAIRFPVYRRRHWLHEIRPFECDPRHWSRDGPYV